VRQITAFTVWLYDIHLRQWTFLPNTVAALRTAEAERDAIGDDEWDAYEALRETLAAE
jgi:hypothetical protein